MHVIWIVFQDAENVEESERNWFIFWFFPNSIICYIFYAFFKNSWSKSHKCDDINVKLSCSTSFIDSLDGKQQWIKICTIEDEKLIIPCCKFIYRLLMIKARQRLLKVRWIFILSIAVYNCASTHELNTRFSVSSNLKIFLHQRTRNEKEQKHCFIIIIVIINHL